MNPKAEYGWDVRYMRYKLYYLKNILVRWSHMNIHGHTHITEYAINPVQHQTTVYQRINTVYAALCSSESQAGRG